MWTEHKFKAELRRAGYVRIGVGHYQHERTGHEFQCFGYDRKRECENWRVWAEVEQTPPPF